MVPRGWTLCSAWVFTNVSIDVSESDRGCILRLCHSLLLFPVFSWTRFPHWESKGSFLISSATDSDKGVLLMWFGGGKNCCAFPPQFNSNYLWSNYSVWFGNTSHELWRNVAVALMRSVTVFSFHVYPLQTHHTHVSHQVCCELQLLSIKLLNRFYPDTNTLDHLLIAYSAALSCHNAWALVWSAYKRKYNHYPFKDFLKLVKWKQKQRKEVRPDSFFY